MTNLPYAEVIGDPIAHSKSPLIHNHWLRILGIAAEYRATHVRPAEFAELLSKRRSDPDWCGCNVTIPHKEAAVALIDECSEEARGIGAVNCIVRREDKLVGYNSDVDGVEAALSDLTLIGGKVVIIGGGGAARAALDHLAARDVREIVILVRDLERARPLELISSARILRIGPLSDAATLMTDAALIINASPLGMTGAPRMPAHLLKAIGEQDAGLFDMVYDPIMTDFLLAGGARRINGLTMLLGQARRAFELFFGVRPPCADEELRDAIARAAKAA